MACATCQGLPLQTRVLHTANVHRSSVPIDVSLRFADANRRIQLAIDSVFGRSGRALIDALSPGATYVQLGFLGGGKDPLQVDTSVLFGRQINMVGFRSSARMAARSELQREHLAGYLVRLFNAGQLVLPPLGLPEVPWVYNSDATDVDDVGQTAARLTDALAAARGAALGQRKQLIVFSDQA